MNDFKQQDNAYLFWFIKFGETMICYGSIKQDVEIYWHSTDKTCRYIREHPS